MPRTTAAAVRENGALDLEVNYSMFARQFCGGGYQTSLLREYCTACPRCVKSSTKTTTAVLEKRRSIFLEKGSIKKTVRVCGRGVGTNAAQGALHLPSRSFRKRGEFVASFRSSCSQFVVSWETSLAVLGVFEGTAKSFKRVP